MKYLAVFCGMFIYVMLRAFQQRNVAFDNYSLVVPTSYAMAVTDIYLISAVAKAGWSLPFVLTYGTAGACGSICAMLFHKRFIKR